MTGNSFFCSECVVNWAPNHCKDSACPLCGGGTVRRQEPVGDDANDLYREVVKQQQIDHKKKMFEEYYQKHCAEKGIEYEPDCVEA